MNDDRGAQDYVLTLHLDVGATGREVVDRAIGGLSHLNALRGPAESGHVLVHCSVTAVSESDAVGYTTQRMRSAFLELGVECVDLVAVETTELSFVAA